ncbi:hypothetical protein H5T53_01755 [Candidatus Bipolaricaulota bacterium]|nr:hypothetical protein [Candidatus Bipolaricaulota bacterium]
MPNLRIRLWDVATVAALLATLSTAFASMSWISAGKAGGVAGDQKTAALGVMILRLEAVTEASNALVQAQTYLTQAAMYYAQAETAGDEELKAFLEGLGDQSLQISQTRTKAAEDWKGRSESYYAKYEEALNQAAEYGNKSDHRSTAALIFNVSAAMASLMVIFKRWKLLLVYAPIFFVGLYYFVASFL